LWGESTQDFKFAAAAASFGMILRDSPHKGNATFDSVLELAREGAGADRHGYRAELLELARRAKSLREQ
jgi:Ca-activated chloride channel family protein